MCSYVYAQQCEATDDDWKYKSNALIKCFSHPQVSKFSSEQIRGRDSTTTNPIFILNANAVLYLISDIGALA